jgi:hypothetical protein
MEGLETLFFKSLDRALLIEAGGCFAVETGRRLAFHRQGHNPSVRRRKGGGNDNGK